MKILFIRHGESQDDILNLYGGWSDYPLTDKGRDQIAQSAEKIKALGYKFDIILTSPLQRAQQSAGILSKALDIKIKVFEYLKERNTYGLLCGMEKNYAKETYPWLVDAYENNEYVDGSEREDDINSRVRKANELMLKMPYSTIIAVTHGIFLKAYFPQIHGKKLTKKEDAGFMFVDTTDNKIICSEGLEIQ